MEKQKYIRNKKIRKNTERERQCNIIMPKSSMNEENIMNNIDFFIVVSSVFSIAFDYAIKTDVKN